MKTSYETKGTCANRIELDIDGGVIRDVVFHNGCEGNLAAISAIVRGMSADEVISKFSGITCGRRGTSCADQLARALRAAK